MDQINLTAFYITHYSAGLPCLPGVQGALPVPGSPHSPLAPEGAGLATFSVGGRVFGWGLGEFRTS